MIVQIENLWKKYGRFDALQGLSLGVPEGGVLSLIGANGAGKTTTLKVLMNLTEPTAGNVTLLGVDSRKLSPKQLARVGYVSENQRMPGRMTVAGYMAYLRLMSFRPAGHFRRQLVASGIRLSDWTATAQVNGRPQQAVD